MELENYHGVECEKYHGVELENYHGVELENYHGVTVHQVRTKRAPSVHQVRTKCAPSVHTGTQVRCAKTAERFLLLVNSKKATGNTV